MDLDVKVIGEKRLQLMETVSIEDWQTAFDSDFEGFMGQLSEMLKTYREALTTQQSASSRINELRVADEGLHRQSDEKRESLDKLLPESKKADEEYSAKRGQLEKLLDGRDPDVLERELKSAVTEQGKKVDAALNTCHNIEVECAELKTKGQEARKRHEECLAGMKELKDKEGEDVIEDDALEATLKSLADELKAADDRRGDVRVLLGAHRTCEEKMKGYKSDLDSRRARYADWRDLNSILGNANGDKLRETAQCFTLGLLVRQANAQLQTLGRRYGLEQVKDTLGIRIIDHDRADEQRNISSLSGGETFVISLALALGLSAISSRNTPMANLFVDEGFGSLDSASLNMVIDALSTLESAQGKKVGVISHTPEMRERIHTQIRVVKTGSGGKSYIEIV